MHANQCISIHTTEPFTHIYSDKFYIQHSGDYNSFFDEEGQRPDYTEVVVNENPLNDKIFSNVEFRADSWLNGQLQTSTFDIIEAYNNYQHGRSDLSFVKDLPSTLKRKFRIWGALIPRDDIHTRDRKETLGHILNLLKILLRRKKLS